MPIGDTSYCFLITNDDEYPSPKRKAMLSLMCEVARGLPPTNKRVMGVATVRDNKSYDFAFVYGEEWTDADEERKKHIQETFGIFVSPRITADGVDEYPKS